MRAVLQRVSSARVSVDGNVVGSIDKGLLVFLGVRVGDRKEDADQLLKKTLGLRIFDDAYGRMNLSLEETGGSLLVVSQFTLYGDTKRGRRPSYIQAAPPEMANELYKYFAMQARKVVERVETGRFQAMMSVELVNDGPVTILIDSEKIF